MWYCKCMHYGVSLCVTGNVQFTTESLNYLVCVCVCSRNISAQREAFKPDSISVQIINLTKSSVSLCHTFVLEQDPLTPLCPTPLCPTPLCPTPCVPPPLCLCQCQTSHELFCSVPQNNIPVWMEVHVTETARSVLLRAVELFGIAVSHTHTHTHTLSIGKDHHTNK